MEKYIWGYKWLTIFISFLMFSSYSDFIATGKILLHIAMKGKPQWMYSTEKQQIFSTKGQEGEKRGSSEMKKLQEQFPKQATSHDPSFGGSQNWQGRLGYVTQGLTNLPLGWSSASQSLSQPLRLEHPVNWNFLRVSI